MNALVSLLSKPLFGKAPDPETAKSRLGAIDALLSRGSGEAWLPIGRPQATLPVKNKTAWVASAPATKGEGALEAKALRWMQFAWSSDQSVDHCILHRGIWRFYENGLVCLEVNASKEKAGLDVRDLVGHTIELRDHTGFLLGVWSAAFLINRATDRTTFQASAIDDYLPLKAHFDQIAETQEGSAFRI